MIDTLITIATDVNLGMCQRAAPEPGHTSDLRTGISWRSTPLHEDDCSENVFCLMQHHRSLSEQQ